jgi:hypothetical protein
MADNLGIQWEAGADHVRVEKNDQQNDMVFDDIAKHTLKYIPKK